jgi:Domain of unknown function (DUF4345)
MVDRRWRILARAALWGNTLVFAGLGLAFTFFSQQLGALVDLTLSTPRALTDFRAVYGGLELGIALFLGFCALRPHRVQRGLGAAAATLGAMGVVRAGAILSTGAWDGTTLCLLGLELGGASLNALLLAKHGTDGPRARA